MLLRDLVADKSVRQQGPLLFHAELGERDQLERVNFLITALLLRASSWIVWRLKVDLIGHEIATATGLVDQALAEGGQLLRW